MDPNEALAELRRLMREVRGAIMELPVDADALTERIATDAAALADQAEALDVWLRGGGFLPTAWRQEEA